MKLKTLMKTVISTRINITVETDGVYHDYVIDYIANKELKKYTHYTECRTVGDLPKAVLDRDVTYIGARKDRLQIDIYEKERGE